MKVVDLRILNIEELATPTGEGFKVMKNAGIAIKDGVFIDVGESRYIESEYNSVETIDATGKSVIPGFVDPHTHLVYSGCRHRELVMRIQGKSYVEILNEGGGIMDTVRKTRSAAEDELFLESLKRINIMLRNGTTSIEVKTGYGLDYETELKMFKVIERLKRATPVDIVSTYLGAHVIPTEYRDNRDRYVEAVLSYLPEFKKYAEFVDVFMDIGAFTKEETRRILSKAKDLSYKIKLHADELANTGGAILAAELGAVSADHLTKTDTEGFEALRKANTVPVILPATTFFLLSRDYANARKMLEMGLPVALATDHNPGTSPTYSMVFVMQLAVFFLHMEPHEALTSATLNAAKAIALEYKVGSVEIGKWADLVVLDAHSYVHLFYELSSPIIETVLKKGHVVFTRD